MSTENDSQREKLINAMKSVPEKLADKWIQVTQTTNAKLAEYETTIETKEKDLKDVVNQLANKDQELANMTNKLEKIETQYKADIEKLQKELNTVKLSSNNMSNPDIKNLIDKFIQDYQVLNGKSSSVINEVKPAESKKTVITDLVEEKPVKKAAKKEETPKKDEDVNVDDVLAELGITDL